MRSSKKNIRAALAAQELEEVQKLADTHADALDELRGRRSSADPDSDSDKPTAVDGLKEALRGIPLRKGTLTFEPDLDDPTREDFDDLDDEDEPESTSSLTSGKKQRRKATTATEQNSGNAIKQPLESATSLSDPLSEAAAALRECGVPTR